AEVLDMTVEQAHEFFASVPAIARKLATLLEVGLGYICLGQSATTLSGGEAQRVKLSLELSKRDTGRTLFILDEPTTGLHFHDIDMLLKVLHRLRDHGNTVVVIEHNLDVIKTADWVVDLGPEGGDGGGRVIAQGTPEEVAQAPESFTGQFLAALLQTAPRRKAASG
ncbi:MAG TPA: excinuclease ABC subunit UvrA, partial [Usitatibacter sp.]|nr:excinuclease ABC subunit UvrA [Usitatibacter sp.]